MGPQPGGAGCRCAHPCRPGGTSQALKALGDTGTTDLHGGQATAVLRQWWQFGYDPVDREVGRYESDLGMLTLAVPVKATPIRMVAHGDTASYAAGTQAKVYGWGRTSSTSQDLSQTLRTATLTLRSDSTCAGVYDVAYVPGRMVCAGTQSGSDTGTSAACNGDSGGRSWWAAGSPEWSLGRNCVEKGYYSVFTTVSAYAGSACRQIDDTNLSTFNGRADGKADIFVRESADEDRLRRRIDGSSFGARASWATGAASTWSFRRTSTGRLPGPDLPGQLHRLRAAGTLRAQQRPHGRLVDRHEDRHRLEDPYPDHRAGRRHRRLPADLLSVDSGGTMRIYPGKGNGTFGSRFSRSYRLEPVQLRARPRRLHR
ncbi:Secreted trypsin-like serine protease OS=Streptomyces violarus OX=67380 GN=FHS41_002232 PE=3 SV=1 [Streptomyces violarus]